MGVARGVKARLRPPLGFPTDPAHAGETLAGMNTSGPIRSYDQGTTRNTIVIGWLTFVGHSSVVAGTGAGLRRNLENRQKI